MSRTVKARKAIGFDYWAARPFNKGGGMIGWFAKRRTHKAERQHGRREANEANR